MFSTLVIFLLTTSCLQTYSEFVDMKIVEEPSSFGVNYPYGGQSTELDAPNLKLRVQPANFSGPPHLKRLLGRCFKTTVKNYKYDFCPFANLTQHEIGTTWNPYHGVLGVWQGWEIKNNTFVAMEFKDGDSCGTDLLRSARIIFQCGNSSQILNVTEPKRCQYLVNLQTPLVCHPDSMLVYPTLNATHARRWDELEGQWSRGELTVKGYDKRLRLIFEDAGLMMAKDVHQNLLDHAKDSSLAGEKDKQAGGKKSGDFESLETCQAEFGKLQQEVKRLMG